MTCGQFSADGREYVITHPATPRPWHNFLFNDEYLANITQLGTGASFFQPLGEGLRTNVTEDRDGNGGPRLVYLRDNDSGQYWSLTGAPGPGTAPLGRPMDLWECRVGMGYQINRSRLNGIEAAWRVIVPPGNDSVELWTLTISNLSNVQRRISVFPYLEMHLTGGSTLMDFIAVLGGRYDPDLKAVLGINSCVKFPTKFKAFLASDGLIAGATVSRDEFLGPYRDYHNPLAVERGDVHNPEAGTEWLGASLRHELVLQPGCYFTFNCAVGVYDTDAEAKRLIDKYLAPGAPQAVFDAIEKSNHDMLDRTVVATGDPQFDRWMNAWLKHQLRFVARWGRVIGRGFRDILQDTFAHRITEPDKARQCLLEVFSKQFPSGKCIRAWRLPIAILDLQDYADSPSWMIMALAMYLKETGDFSILQEKVPFLNDKDPYAPPTKSATMWEHVVLAQTFLLEPKNLGSHNLCKIYYGDWCDTMNGVGKAGKGESVMLSMQVKWGCDLLAELAQRPQVIDLVGAARIKKLVRQMQQAGAQLADAINQHAWDGKWYVRAFDDQGVAVGSDNPPPSDNGEGRIFLNAQSWSIISGVASPQRAASSVDSARKYLDVGYGMVLNWPAFTGLKPRIGQMTAMSPGFYENASVYVHGNCFWIYALAHRGQGHDAWNAIRAILPDTLNKPNGDTEPFIIPNYYIGPNVTRRMQRNLYLSGWRTGSASFLYMTMLEWILGARAEYDGLRIDPHLPQGWTTASLTRSFRNNTYRITLENPTGSPDAVARQVFVNGQPLEGTLITPDPAGGEHTVRVVMA